MKKKILLFALALFLILPSMFVFSACGDNSPTVNVEIKTTKQFMEMQYRTAQSGKQYYYKLVNDLDFEGIEYDQKYLFDVGFKNIFDGQNYKIKNLTLSGDYASIFVKIGYGEPSDPYSATNDRRALIKNLKIENINITSGNYIGAIIGRDKNMASNASRIENIEILSGTIGNAESKYVGGIAGSMEYCASGVVNCINRATIQGDSFVGGCFGYSSWNYYDEAGSSKKYRQSTIKNLTNYGNVTAYKSNSEDNNSGNAGGIVGAFTTSNNAEFIDGCKNYGNITCENNYYAGGICGNAHYEPLSPMTVANDNTLDVSNCENHGNVIAKKFAGGIIGQLGNNYEHASFTNLTNTGKITSKTDFSGGIVGNNLYKLAIFNNCKNESTENQIIGQNYVGGICGHNGRFRNCSNTMELKIGSTATVKTDYSYAGGIVGCNDLNDSAKWTEITNCSNTGNITTVSGNENSTFSYIGGITGFIIQPDVNNCSNSGNITGTNNVGGLFGYMKAYTGTKQNINCTNSGKITALGQTTASSVDFADLTESTIVGNIGGIVGFYMHFNPYSEKFVFKDCSNTGDIYIMNYTIRVGGMIGYAYYDKESVKKDVEDCISIVNPTLNYDFYYKSGLNPSYCSQVIGYANVGDTSSFNNVEFAQKFEIPQE